MLDRLAAERGTAGRVVTGADVDDLWPRLVPLLAPDAVILLKASRGMRLERLVPHLERWASGTVPSGATVGAGARPGQSEGGAPRNTG